MPCKECENGKYKFGENGECQYDTLEDCEMANSEKYLEETLKPKTKEIVHDHEYHFTDDDMEDLHTSGELYVTVEGENGEKMILLFTYHPEGHDEEEKKDVEIEDEHKKKRYNELTNSMLDEELDSYIDKLTDSLKKL